MKLVHNYPDAEVQRRFAQSAIYYKTEREPVLHRLCDILPDRERACSTPTTRYITRQRESLFYTDYAIYYKTEREPVLHRLRDILQDRERACSTPTTRNSSPDFCLRVIVNEFIQILKRRYILSYLLF